MLPPDSRITAFELIRPPSGYRLDFAVLTTYTLDLEALLVLPLSVLAHPEGGLEELLADPLRLHQAIRDAGDRVHAFVDEKGIAIPRGARSLYSMLESSVHPVRAPNGGAFHPKVWVARFTAADEAAEDLLRVAVLSRNLNFDRSWDVALASEALLRSRRFVKKSRPLRDFLSALPQLATGPIPQGIVERVETLADQVWRTAFPAPDDFESPIAFHAIGLTRGRRTWSPPSSGHRALAVAPFANRTGLDAVGTRSGNDRILVSRQEELDKLSDDALAAWQEIFVLSDTAQGEAEDGPADRDEDGPADTAGAADAADTAGTNEGEAGTGVDARPSGAARQDDRRRARLACDVVHRLREPDRGGVHRQQRRGDGVHHGQEGKQGERQGLRHRSLPGRRIPEVVRAVPKSRARNRGHAPDRSTGTPRSGPRCPRRRRPPSDLRFRG